MKKNCELFLASNIGNIDNNVLYAHDEHHLKSSNLAELCIELLSIFENNSNIRSIVLRSCFLKDNLYQHAYQNGIIKEMKNSDNIIIDKSNLYQHPYSALVPAHIPHFPYSLQVRKGIGYPSRPPFPEGVIYSRYIKSIGITLSLQTLNIEKHFEFFHDWMNQKRVAKFWELEGDVNIHLDYLKKLKNNKNSHPIIGYFNDIPFSYFELYWAKEDRISAYYPARDYDRGLHVLVGDKRFLGPNYFSSWIISIMHYAFISEPRCDKLVGEPRIDNTVFINKLTDFSWVKQKEFDFPHKRAYLLTCCRDTFFKKTI